MSIGVNVVRDLFPEAFPRVLLYPVRFGWLLSIANQEKKLNSYLREFKEQLHRHGDSVESVVFPYCFAHHWFMINISFANRRVEYAEGFNREPLPIIIFQEIMSFLKEHLEVDTTSWDSLPKRREAPQQTDGYSCGPIALECILDVCSGFDPSKFEPIIWDESLADQRRLDWINRSVWQHWETRHAAKKALAESLVQPEVHSEKRLHVVCQCTVRVC